MAKLTLQNLSNLQNETSAVNIINANNDAIEAAVENTLSRDATPPNQMARELDMNGQQILNLPAPATILSPLRVQDVADPAVVLNVPPVGTSGATVGLLNTDLTFSGNNTHTGTETFTNLTTLTSNLRMTANTPSIEMGSTSVSNTPYLDFHSSGNNIDFDSRILASGGTGSVGQGALTITAGGGVNVSGNLAVTGNYTGNGTTLTGVETSAHASSTYSPILRTQTSFGATTYTLQLSDTGSIIYPTSNSPVTITVPNSSSVAFTVGTQIDFIQFGSGKVTFSAAGGVTLLSANSYKSIAGTFSACSIVLGAPNTWYLIGSLQI